MTSVTSILIPGISGTSNGVGGYEHSSYYSELLLIMIILYY